MDRWTGYGPAEDVPLYYGSAVQRTRHIRQSRPDSGLDSGLLTRGDRWTGYGPAEDVPVLILDADQVPTRVHPCEQIHKSIIGSLPRKHAKSQQLVT